MSAYEKKTFELSGFAEFRPEYQDLRRNSTGYLIQFPGESRSSQLRHSEAIELSGVIRRESLSFRFTGHASRTEDPRGTDSDGRMYEAYGAWQADAGINFELGKRSLRWGKGYAWSPVAFLERAKDPTDPELAREGFTMATASWVRTFERPLQTLALNAVLVPTTSGLNTEYGAAEHLNPAVKLYGLIYDTDVDLIWAGNGSKGERIGFDFSRNLGSNLEVHGEWARVSDAPRSVLTASNSLRPQVSTYESALIGLRYLTERETTIIAELFHQGNGYTTDEMDQYYDAVRTLGANPDLFPVTSRAAAQGYGRPTSSQHYAYLRASQKEPFDILDFTPAINLITNTSDHSWSLIPELAYIGIRNIELRFRMTLNHGNASTEYGEKPVRTRSELRARYYF